jgi:hypothetical protein
MITKLTRHDGHEVTIHLTPNLRLHYAELRCVQCQRHIQWLSRRDVELLQGKYSV